MRAVHVQGVVYAAGRRGKERTEHIFYVTLLR